MRGNFDRRYIENLVSVKNNDYSDALQEKILNLVASAVEELSSRVPFISIENTIFQPFNETFNGAFTPMSKYIYLLGINSPQIEANSLNKSVNLKKIKQNFIDAWQNTKKRKSKRRKRKEEEESHKYTEFEPEKYNLESLRRDLQLAIAQYLGETSIVYNTSDRLIIQGKEDFGSISQIEIIPVIYDGDYFKYFVSKRKGYLNINMEERLINFNMKSEMVGENFFTILRVFNNLFRNVTKESLNQIFVESLLYNVPNELFEGKDIYQIVINILNYLSMTSVGDFVSIENKTEKIFKSKKTGNAAALYTKLMKSL